RGEVPSSVVKRRTSVPARTSNQARQLTPPATAKRPSRENAAQIHREVRSPSRPRSLPGRVAHSRSVWPCEAKNEDQPMGENTTAQTVWVCPVMVGTSLRDGTSQTGMVPSCILPPARDWPSGEKAREVTGPEWPVKRPASRPVLRSHRTTSEPNTSL